MVEWIYCHREDCEWEYYFLLPTAPVISPWGCVSDVPLGRWDGKQLALVAALEGALSFRDAPHEALEVLLVNHRA